MPAETYDLAKVGPMAGLLSVRLRRVNLLLSDELFGSSLRPEAFACLAVISADPGISQNEVARLIRRDPATIVGMVNDLEERGWASRQPSAADRRKHALHLTAAGEAELERLAERIKAIEDDLLADVPAAELAFLNYLLDKIHASCLRVLEAREPR